MAPTRTQQTAGIPQQQPSPIGALPPELVRHIFQHLMCYPEPQYRRRKSKVYKKQHLSGDEVDMIMRFPWDASAPCHDTLHHPRATEVFVAPWDHDEVGRNLCAWRATCRSWRDIAQPLASSCALVDMQAAVHEAVPAGARHVDLYFLGDSYDYEEQEPRPLPHLLRALRPTSAASLISLTLDAVTLSHFEGIVSILPGGGFEQLQALRLEGRNLDWIGDAPDNFYPALSKCTSMRQLCVSGEGFSGRDILNSIGPLRNLRQLVLDESDGTAPINLPSLLMGKPLRYLDLPFVNVSLETLLAAAGECADTLQFLHIGESSWSDRFQKTEVLTSTFPSFPRLQFLSISGGHMLPRDEPCWTTRPALVALLDNCPRLEHLEMLYHNWDEEPRAAAAPSTTGPPPPPPPPTPARRFLDKIENGVVKKALLQGPLSLELKQVLDNPPQAWRESKFEMLFWWD